MSADVDAEVLKILRTIADPTHPLGVYDGDVDGADHAEKVIAVALPYLVFYSTPGYRINRRMSGHGGRAVEFTINAVGLSRDQAKWAGQRAEDALDNRRIQLVTERLIRRTEDNGYVRRDDTWTRPNGKPLFTDSRSYSIAAH